MSIEHDPADFSSILCAHSKVATSLVGSNWSEKLGISINPDNIRDSYQSNEENGIEPIHCKEKTGSELQNLISVFIDGEVSLLFTVGKQKIPRCSRCHSKNCKCIQLYRKTKKESQDISPENLDVSESYELSEDPAHYDQKEGQYGYNRSTIIYPLYSDKNQAMNIDLRRSPEFSFPSKLIPKFDQEYKCKKHGNTFNENDACLKLCATHIIVHEENKETIYPCNVYYRETVGSCKCQQHYDGHELLLFHVGLGKMVCYFTLQNYLHNWVNSGITKYAFFKSIKNNLKSIGQISCLSYHVFYKAVDGFVQNLSLDYKECFSYLNCGVDPKYFVGDGKCIGPLQKKLAGLKLSELSSHPNDDKILEQGSRFSDRILLADKKERDIVCELLTGNVDMEHFINSDIIKSENGKSIQELVRYIQLKWPLKIPDVFVKFIADISKSSSVAGLLQVTNHRTLVLLKKFCLEEIDIRSPTQDSKLKYLNSELPTFWPQLVAICELNKSTFLPSSVRKIVLCLIKIRKNTFKKSPQRYQEDYFPYEKEGIYKEDPTQFYPNHPINQYPKLYNVSGNDDKDHCHKIFSSHSDFIDGNKTNVDSELFIPSLFLNVF